MRVDRLRSVPHAVGLVAAACLAVYLVGLQGSFQFDDFNVIVDNEAVHSLAAWWQSMPGIRPLLKLSYALNWIIAPQAPAFRAVNLVCHLVNGVLVYVLLREWMRQVPARAHDAPWLALLAALIFVLHPAQTEAVTYVSGRSVSLMGTFYLMSLLAFSARSGNARQLSSHEAASAETARGGALIASLLCFGCALATKETAWTLPFALVLVLYGIRRIPLREALRRTRWHWLVLTLALLAASSLPRYRDLFWTSIATRTLAENLLAQIDGVSYLLTQPLLLLTTNIDPDLPAHGTPTPMLAAKGACLFSLFAFGALLAFKRAWAGVAIVWLLLHLLPTNSLLPRLDIANDRQLYLGMIGPALLAAGGMVWCAHQRPAGAAIVVVAVMVLLGGMTMRRNQDYATEVSLWQATVRESPNKARAWNNLGHAYRQVGRKAEAIAAFERALQLNPDAIKARHNLEALKAH